MSDCYILKDGKPVKVKDLIEWARWFEKSKERIVKLTTIKNDIRVSTVFLGLDHNYSGKGKPILWETMIFGGPHDQYQQRYTSRKYAMKGHAEAVKLAKKNL